MRLLQLEVSDVRRYTGVPRVVTFDPRATVLHGPNEAGKTTLFEAVRHALFDRARTQARWVERLVPYGTRALPTVRLDFEHAGRTLRIEKRFGGKGDTALSERHGAEWTTVAPNEDAEEQLLAILGAVASGARDGAPPESWGPFQWLLVPQELRELPNEKSDAAGRLGLDSAGVSDEFEGVRRLVQAAHDKTYTSTGKVSKTSELDLLAKHIEGLEAERATLAAEVARLDDLRQRLDTRNEELPRMREDVAAAKRDWDAVQEEAIDLSGAEGALAAAGEALKSARDRATAAADILKERGRLEPTARELEEKRARATTDALGASAVLQQVERLWNEARASAGTLGDRVAALRKQLSDAERTIALRDSRRELAAIEGRFRRCEEADGRIIDAQGAVHGEAPAAGVVKRADLLHADAAARRASARGVALRVAIEGRPAFRVLADGVEIAGEDGTAFDAVVVEGAGGRVIVRGDTSEAQRLTDEAADFERKRDALLAPFGVPSVEALRALREDRLRADADLESARKERAAVDPRSTSDIRAEIAKRTATIAEAERIRSEGDRDVAHDAMDDDALRAAASRLAEDTKGAERSFEEVRKARDSRNAEVEKSRQAERAAGQARERAVVAANAARDELDRHRDRYGSTDKVREAAATARTDLDAAEVSAATARGNLDRLSRDATVRRQAAKQKYDHLETALHAAEADIRHWEETLERDSVRGPYTRLAEVERTIEAERARHARLEVAARAAKLAKEAMDAVRGEVVRRVVAPIKGDLDGLLATATMGRYTVADLDDHLRPGALAGATGVRCEFDDGSQGLRELVSTLVRIAVAEHLARAEPQTLVLDDPCVHVSRERTARLVDILNTLTAAGRVQVVVLTHRQSEFSGLLGTAIDVSAV